MAGFTWTAGGGKGYSELSSPSDICVDQNGTMYILDAGNNRVVKWLRDEPLGFTVAGGHGLGSASNQIGDSRGLYVDNEGNIYISEYGNHRVSKWYKGNTASGIVVSNIE